MMMYRILVIIIAILLFPLDTTSQQKLVKILVASSYIEENAYQPVADVMVGCIIRELKKQKIL